ncbi:MAG: hypothetical protein ACP6IP_07930 [Candidatus Njordarchaeia archaeon]
MEFYGFDFAFLLSTVLMISLFLLSFALRDVGGGLKPSLDTVIRITFKNINEVFTSVNSVSVYPIIRTYGTLLMLEAGLSEGIIGIILTIHRIMGVVMQYLGAKFHRWIMEKKEIINFSALGFVILFAYFTNIGEIILGISSLIASAILSNLLPTGQLTKSTTENGEYTTTGAGGFGTGLSLVRLFYTSTASGAGYLSETYTPMLDSAFVATFASVSFFMAITSLKIVKKAVS